MSKWTKILCLILAPLGVVFCFVGYAALTTTLTIEGTAEATPPDAIYITEIWDIQYTGASTVNADGAPTRVAFPSTKFLSNIKFDSAGSTVSFMVRIKNGTSYNQIFDILKSYSELEGVGAGYDSSKITADAGIEQGVVIPAGEEIECRVVLTADARGIARHMLYEFQFVLNSADLTEKISVRVTDRFAKILNNELEEITYSYEYRRYPWSSAQTVTETVEAGKSYEAITGSNMNDSDSGDYIGNVDGAQAVDIALVNGLFGGELLLDINGEERPVTVMVKKQMVYNNDSVEEMVLYLTADTLDSGRVNGQDPEAPVYVAVFAQKTRTDANGNPVTKWEQVGPIFAGKARQTNYYGFSGTGSSNTDYWVTTEEYNGIAAGATLSAVMAGVE